MAGNVREWVNDKYGATYYSQSPSRNPQGPASGNFRVLRGGSWLIYGYRAGSAVRFNSDPAYSYYEVGFRCSSYSLPTQMTTPTNTPYPTNLATLPVPPTKLHAGFNRIDYAPRPSKVGEWVTANVIVLGQSDLPPTGTVTITGADTTCTMEVSGIPGVTDTCSVVFNSPGNYTLTATYSGDSNYDPAIYYDTTWVVP
jgi:hypothetical protein